MTEIKWRYVFCILSVHMTKVMCEVRFVCSKISSLFSSGQYPYLYWSLLEKLAQHNAMCNGMYEPYLFQQLHV